MSIEIKAPTFPESIADGTIASWYKKPCEFVARDELIVDIETDKVVLEIVAPADGSLTEIRRRQRGRRKGSCRKGGCWRGVQAAAGRGRPQAESGGAQADR